MSRVEDALQAVVEAFATAFAGRIRGCYVEGSYADGSEVTCSDVDMVVVFKDGFVGDKERRQAEAVGQRCVAESAVELDLVIEDEYGLRRGAWPTLKLGSILLYGEDIRDGLQLIPLVEWTRDRMHSSLWRTAHLCGRSSVMMPLDYPDPQGEFYGYDQRKMRLAGGEEVQGTRDLIRLVSWSATAILGCRAGQYVARKSDCHTLYRRYIADEWAGLLEDIYA
ncbi:MAG: nucleotidyltransferase domain-containing protein, partial [Ktedonobacteraceae bacterium]|nr:nucleotidyltransferase domain-containing protein [Ktedonobacteraceae bacterium]